MNAKTAIFAGFVLMASGACRQDMHDQPKYEPYEATDFFHDGLSSRSLVEGVVPRGELREDTLLYTGKQGGEFATGFPAKVDASMMKRGQERYNIYCSPCHDRAGTGNGMIVQRGMKQPKSFHVERLRNSPPGYFFDVITNGYGVMYSYSSRVKTEDRWAIVAYIRALQMSQHMDVNQLTPKERGELEKIDE